MKRKLLCLAAAFCLCLSFALPASAEDNGYRITQFSVDATLHENNTVTQTETISVEFLEPRHGIFRQLPTTVTEWRNVDGAREKITYSTEINDVTVEGGPFEQLTEDGRFVLRIGDPDETFMGNTTYVIRYTYDIGDDRVSDDDELFYSLNGPDWDTTIDNFSFTLRFEKPLPQASVDSLVLSSGLYGDEGNSADIEMTASTQLITGSAHKTLPAHHAVTVHTMLPEGYFVGERAISMLPAWVAFFAMLALALYTLIRILLTRHRRPVQTVEFYPPEGLTSADVGFIIDNTADDRDLISLVIWLADKGYLSLSQCEDDETVMQLTKLKKLPADMPQYVKDFFAALFASRKTRRMDSKSSAFYTAFTAAKTQLTLYHLQPERCLAKPGTRTLAFLLPIGSAVLWGIFAAFAACRVEIFPIAFIAFVVMALAGCTLAAISADGRHDFVSGATRVWQRILPIILAALAMLCVFVVMSFSLLEPSLLLLAGAGLCAICCIFAPRLIEETPYRVEMAGKLMGLRNFIKTAELPRLKMLVEENPTYFYNVLPYAYVFGLSDKWVKQFEPLSLAPPTWYAGSNMMGYLYFDHAMRSNIDASLRTLHAESSDSGSGGSSSWGSSGGGFSGGGFGGGGGGSW